MVALDGGVQLPALEQLSLGGGESRRSSAAARAAVIEALVNTGQVEIDERPCPPDVSEVIVPSPHPSPGAIRAGSMVTVDDLHASGAAQAGAGFIGQDSPTISEALSLCLACVRLRMLHVYMWDCCITIR